MSGSWVVASVEAALCRGVCVAASRSKVVLGWGLGGRALERLRCANSAKENCVAASANVAGIVLLVLLWSVLHKIHEYGAELCAGRGFFVKHNCRNSEMESCVEASAVVAWCVGGTVAPSVYGHRE